MENDRRQYKCTTLNCRGVVFREGDKIKCTDCPMIVPARRVTDIHLMSFKQMQKEFNGV